MAALNHAFVNHDARTAAERGMRVEGIDQLAAGALLYRFVQRADVRDDTCSASPWWFQQSAVRRILEAARMGHRGEDSVAGQAARMAALSATWPRSGANYLLAAKARAPLAFFWGAPRPVGKRSAAQTEATGLASGDDIHSLEHIPDPRCTQFFIPGLWDPALSGKAIRVVSRTKFSHSADLADGDIDTFLRQTGG